MKQIVPGELYAAMAHIDPSKRNSWLDELLWVVLLLSSLTKDLREVCFNNLPLRQSFLHNAQVPYATLQISDRHICSAAKIVGELGLNTTTLLKTVSPFASQMFFSSNSLTVYFACCYHQIFFQALRLFQWHQQRRHH